MGTLLTSLSELCPRSEELLAVAWLFNVPATGSCISGTDVLRQLYVLPHFSPPLHLSLTLLLCLGLYLFFFPRFFPPPHLTPSLPLSLFLLSRFSFQTRLNSLSTNKKHENNTSLFRLLTKTVYCGFTHYTASSVSHICKHIPGGDHALVCVVHRTLYMPLYLSNFVFIPIHLEIILDCSD